MISLQHNRLIIRSSFFVLFLLAPPLNIFRFDLTLGHFILFGQPWTLGLDPFLAGQADVRAAIFNIVVRGFLPLAATAALLLWVAWKYGRLYCGWLCPHFSVVETINALMRRTIGKHSIWDRDKLPERDPDGRVVKPNAHFGWVNHGKGLIIFPQSFRHPAGGTAREHAATIGPGEGRFNITHR